MGSFWGRLAPAHPGAGIASVPVPLAARHRLKKSWRYADHNPVVAAVLTMASIQAYFVARDSLASFFDTAGVGVLNLGWTIQQVPETIIGTAIAVAMLPSLAEFINPWPETGDFVKTINRALRVMLGLSLPVAVILALTIRPLVASFFGYDANRLNLVTWCTWAFLFGLVGDTWLEVAVRSYYADQNTRTPLVAAFLQAVSFVILSLILRPLLGLAGIPLAVALTFTTQALVLLSLQNRRFPGLIDVKTTAVRAGLAAILAGIVAPIFLLGSLQGDMASDMLRRYFSIPIRSLIPSMAWTLESVGHVLNSLVRLGACTQLKENEYSLSEPLRQVREGCALPGKVFWLTLRRSDVESDELPETEAEHIGFCSGGTHLVFSWMNGTFRLKTFSGAEVVEMIAKEIFPVILPPVQPPVRPPAVPAVRAAAAPVIKKKIPTGLIAGLVGVMLVACVLLVVGLVLLLV